MTKNKMNRAAVALLACPIVGGVLLMPVEARAAAHPLIWLDSAMLAELRQKAGDKVTEWVDLKRNLDAHLDEDFAAGYQGSDWYDRLMAYALGYQVLRGTDDTTADAYAAKALVYAKALSRDNLRSGTVGDAGGGDDSIQVDSGWVARTAGMGLAIGYDWLYDYPGLDDATKAEFADRLNAWIAWYESDGFARDNYSSNYFMGYFSMKALAGYALEDAAQAASANELWDAHVVPRFNEELVGGDWIASNWNYGPGVVQKVAGYLLARKTATGVDSVVDFPWIEQHLDYKIHALHPGGTSVYVDGPWSGSDPGYVTNRDMVYVHQVLKGKPVAEYLQWYMLHDTETMGHGATDWETFLFYNADDPTADYTKAKPLQYRAGDGVKGYGFVGMRSSWSDDATWVGFRAGGGGIGETDDVNQGHFEIFKNDLLAVNAGMWQHDGATTFRQGESDFANIFKVVDTDGCQQYHDEEKSQAYSGHAEVTQVKYAGEADGYVYIDADLRGAYKANSGCYPLKYYHRQFFYLRPDYVVVLDRVTARAADYTKAFLLHWPGKPSVDGRTASGTYPLTNPTGKLQFASLSPANVEISTSPDLADHPDSLIRMTVTAADANASEIFLNAMRATTPSDKSAFSPTLITADGDKMVGLKIMADKDYYVMFSAGADDTPVKGAVSYSYEPGMASEHYWVDLPASAAFDVTTTNGAITITPGSGSLSSSTEGVLRFSGKGELRAGLPRADTGVAGASNGDGTAKSRHDAGCACFVSGSRARSSWPCGLALCGVLLACARRFRGTRKAQGRAA